MRDKGVIRTVSRRVGIHLQPHFPTFAELASIPASGGRNSDTLRASQDFRPDRSLDQSHVLRRVGTIRVSSELAIACVSDL